VALFENIVAWAVADRYACARQAVSAKEIVIAAENDPEKQVACTAVGHDTPSAKEGAVPLPAGRLRCALRSTARAAAAHHLEAVSRSGGEPTRQVKNCGDCEVESKLGLGNLSGAV
jgi:hypothetical protein